MGRAANRSEEGQVRVPWAGSRGKYCGEHGRGDRRLAAVEVHPFFAKLPGSYWRSSDDRGRVIGVHKVDTMNSAAPETT